MHFNVIDFKKIYKKENEITSSDFINKKKFNDDGLFSERIFGENSDNRDVDVLGWINFGKYYIISPTFFKRIEKCIKPKILDKIINYDMKTNEKGELLPSDPKPIEYQNSGLIYFKEHFLEIMEKYANTEVKEYPHVMKAYEEDKLFINIYPVFSAKLRPGMIYKGSKSSKPTIKYDDINGLYNFVVEYSIKLKEIEGYDEENDKKLILLPMLYNLQNYCNQIANYIIDNFLKEKKGVLRRLIASSRVNFSSRNVLTPKLEGKIDEIELPYLTFLELYRFLLVNLIIKTEGISPVEADLYVQSCRRHFDKKMYKYMMMLINNSKYGCRILLNRNP